MHEIPDHAKASARSPYFVRERRFSRGEAVLALALSGTDWDAKPRQPRGWYTNEQTRMPRPIGMHACHAMPPPKVSQASKQRHRQPVYKNKNKKATTS